MPREEDITAPKGPRIRIAENTVAKLIETAASLEKRIVKDSVKNDKRTKRSNRYMLGIVKLIAKKKLKKTAKTIIEII